MPRTQPMISAPIEVILCSFSLSSATNFSNLSRKSEWDLTSRFVWLMRMRFSIMRGSATGQGARKRSLDIMAERNRRLGISRCNYMHDADCPVVSFPSFPVFACVRCLDLLFQLSFQVLLLELIMPIFKSRLPDLTRTSFI